MKKLFLSVIKDILIEVSVINKIIKTISILYFPIFIAGCMQTFTIPAADVSVLTPAIMHKIPMKVAVVIPDEVEAFTFTGKPHNPGLRDGGMEPGYNLAATFPLGQMLKKAAPDALSYIFTDVVLAKGGPYPQDVDAVIFPAINEFYYWYSIISDANPFSRKWMSNAKISIKLSVLDRNGMLLFEKTVTSDSLSQAAGKIIDANNSNTFQEPTGKAAAESIAAALRDAAKIIAVSPEMHTYASTKGEHRIAMDSLSRQSSLAITSDVDELPVVKVKQNKNAYAIVIGIEIYRQSLPKADFASQDARLVADYLIKALGYPEENVVLLTNDKALQSDLAKYFEKWLQNNVEKGGTVFIYYSGHGAPDPKTGGAYLVPYDGDPAFIAETGFSLQRLYDSLGKLQAGKVIVALDSCFSGAGGRSVIAKGARPLVMNMQAAYTPAKNITILSASSGDQISSTYDEKGHGLFTYFMLKGIKNEDVVAPDGSIRVDDLFGYLKPQVERIARKQYNNEQTPQLFGGK